MPTHTEIRVATFINNLQKIHATRAWPKDVDYDQLVGIGVPMLELDISAGTDHRERSLFQHVMSENPVARDVHNLWRALSHRQDALDRVQAFVEHGPWLVTNPVEEITFADVESFYRENKLVQPEVSAALDWKWTSGLVWGAPKHALILHWVRAGRPPFSCALFLETLSTIDRNSRKVTGKYRRPVVDDAEKDINRMEGLVNQA